MPNMSDDAPSKPTPIHAAADPDLHPEKGREVDEGLIPPEVRAEMDAELDAFEADYARALSEFFTKQQRLNTRNGRTRRTSRRNRR